MAESRVSSFTSTISFTNTTTNSSSTSLGGSQSSRENASTSQSYSMVSGTGVSAAPGNFFDSYAKYTGVLQSGSILTLNFSGLTHELIDDSTENRVFSHINGFEISNNATGSGEILLVQATGSDAFTNIFNGGSGNIKVNPYGSFQYLDYWGATKVTGSNRLLNIVNNGTTGIEYQYMAVGYTGATS